MSRCTIKKIYFFHGMEQARVVIIGAGPSGLALALALAQHQIKNVVLEREHEITKDPRGVYLAADAVRILYDLGLSADIPIIGHELDTVYFHTSTFNSPPFHKIDTHRDSLQQSVPTGILQVQPALEHALHERIKNSAFCDLRVGCDVRSLTEEDSDVQIEYIASDGSTKHIRTAWLIGADGKRGVVRKTFLEPIADIRQVHSDYRYEGTWIAANLHILLPTKETHPSFPAWDLGMTPEEVYDLFWPRGWHFCSPPGKPTATGPFGPHDQRLWRHEFRQDDWDEKTMNAEELFWEHLTPMISRTETADGRAFPTTAVYPKDCIEIMRCRPFTFTHKLVNQWFHRKSVLIGDAAHVFPPFGGQGIASGIRDAHQLAFRIAILEDQPHASDQQVERMLNDWAKERILSIHDAALLTQINGAMCNNQSMRPLTKGFQWVQSFGELLLESQPRDPQALAEQAGLTSVTGFFLKEFGGGKRLPQIYLNTLFGRRVLSDSIFNANDSPLRLLVMVQSNECPKDGLKALQNLLIESKISPKVLSPDSIVVLSREPCQPESVGFVSPTTRRVSPTPLNQLSKKQERPGYDIAAFQTRLGSTTRYAILRPDFFVFSTATDIHELALCFERLHDMLNPSHSCMKRSVL